MEEYSRKQGQADLKKYFAKSWASNGTSGRSRRPTPSRASSRPTMSVKERYRRERGRWERGSEERRLRRRWCPLRRGERVEGKRKEKAPKNAQRDN